MYELGGQENEKKWDGMDTVSVFYTFLPSVCLCGGICQHKKWTGCHVCHGLQRFHENE